MAITEERLKEMEEEMNRFEEEISTVQPPMGHMIIGANTFHQVQEQLSSGPIPGPPGPPGPHMGSHPRGPGPRPRPPGPGPHSGPRQPPVPGPPPRAQGPPPPRPPAPPPRMIFPNLPPPPPPPLDLAMSSNVPIGPAAPPPAIAPRPAFVPHQIRHRMPGPPGGRHPYPPQGMPLRPPPMGGMPPPRGMHPPPMRGPGPYMGGPGGPGGLPPPPMYQGPPRPPMVNKPPSVIQAPKVVYSAAPVKNVPAESKQIEEVKSLEPVIVEMPTPEPEPVVIPDMRAEDPSQSGGIELMECDGDPSKPKGKKSKKDKFVRTAAGQSWEDQTLGEWEQDDFRIFAGDLGNEVTEELLTRAFSRYPSFLKAKVVRDKRTNKTRGYGFLSFKDPNDFVRAMREMNGKYVGNRPIKLRKSAWKDRQTDIVKKKEKEKKRLGFR